MYEARGRFAPLVKSSSVLRTCKARISSRHYPKHINELIKNKLIAWRRWKRTKAEADLTAYRTIETKCVNAIYKFNVAKEVDLIRNNNIRSFYNFVNRRMSDKAKISDIRCPDGSLTSDNLEKSNIFNAFFSSVFTSDNGLCPAPPSRVNDTFIKTVTFTPDAVFETLKKLKPSTSSGPDGLPNVFLKTCARALSVPLCHIFGTLFKDGVLPES